MPCGTVSSCLGAASSSNEDIAIMTTPQKQAKMPMSSIFKNCSLLMTKPKMTVQNACVFYTMVNMLRGRSDIAKMLRV